MIKRIFISFVFISVAIFGYAQDYRDVVYLKNGSVIKGFYRDLYTNDTLRMETLDGSMLVCPMSEVVRIAKERTNIYVINKEDEALTTNRPWRIKGYSGSVELQYGASLQDDDMQSYGIYTTHGYRFNRHIFLGAGIGVENYSWEVSNIRIESRKITVPIYAETRYYLLKTRISPVVSCRGGYSTVGVQGGFISPGIGVDFCISPRTAGFVRVLYRWQHYSYNAPDIETQGSTDAHYEGSTSYIMITGGIRF